MVRIEKVTIGFGEGAHRLVGGLFRYGLLDRVSRCAASRQIVLLAFGFEVSGLRLVLEGESDAIEGLVRGVKGGTARSLGRWGLSLGRSCSSREEISESELRAAVCWAHTAPPETIIGGPLITPWTSHRDLMQLRRASFYDASVLDGRVDPLAVHESAGGRPLPHGWPPPPGERESLSRLLRVAGGVLGLMPADRRCFHLFVHLARARGWPTRSIAEALVLTRRRIRQIAAAPSPEQQVFGMALATLADPRLAQVP